MTKQVPSKNYIILAVIILITVISVFYARNWYITAQEYNSDNSPMLKVITEINPGEISNYKLENPRFILYTSSGLNTNIKSFESKFKNYVLDKNININMIYVNTANINQEEFTKELQNYANKAIKDQININENVNMFIFENGQITKIIKNANTKTNKEIDSLLKKYGMLDNA